MISNGDGSGVIDRSFLSHGIMDQRHDKKTDLRYKQIRYKGKGITPKGHGSLEYRIEGL